MENNNNLVNQKLGLIASALPISGDDDIKNKKIVILSESVKSKFNILNIFSFLDESKKLNIIKYNKKYQTLLDDNIECYKTISEK